MIARRNLIAALSFAVASVAAAGGSSVLTSRRSFVPLSRGSLLNHLPGSFGAWRRRPARDDMIDPVVTDEAFAEAIRMYDATASQDYVTLAGDRIMLSVVFMRKIAQEARFHRPEFCYSTQGFQVARLPSLRMSLMRRSVGLSRFIASMDSRRELVVYWTRVAGDLPTGSNELRLAIMKNSWSETFPDGVLVRASLFVEPGETIVERTAVLIGFLEGLIRQSAGPVRRFLVAV
ncbi:EpsI family protein [Sphingomonas sp. BIUV-7]|uniref:EpsI family protein n=1 Tax=Sphingomonas natans TaxID=3063330 RepID=A0ABT8YCK5_9SPHN|nr:exosortase C-terminal domain/associated protein EpsI [Sphingomonas sp. BIUV-7]MDO6416073.1 EpsI family protein [Sphingomonas sp. BIUV-7]